MVAYTTTSTATIVAGACKKYKIDLKGTIKDRAKAAYDTMRDKQSEDSNNVGAGWFPSSFVAQATAKELSRLQALLSRSVGDAEPGNAVNDVLAPPSTWQELPEGARGAVHFVPVDPNSAEYGQVHSAFTADLRGTANILGIERIQNRGLWQSYAVKCQTIRLREDDRRRDNLSAIPDAEIERMWFFHGSDADTLMNKISAQGFNRSFAGKNATMYGKGVYFARGAHDVLAARRAGRAAHAHVPRRGRRVLQGHPGSARARRARAGLGRALRFDGREPGRPLHFCDVPRRAGVPRVYRQVQQLQARLRAPLNFGDGRVIAASRPKPPPPLPPWLAGMQVSVLVHLTDRLFV